MFTAVNNYSSLTIMSPFELPEPQLSSPSILACVSSVTLPWFGAEVACKFSDGNSLYLHVNSENYFFN